MSETNLIPVLHPWFLHWSLMILYTLHCISLDQRSLYSTALIRIEWEVVAVKSVAVSPNKYALTLLDAILNCSFLQVSRKSKNSSIYSRFLNKKIWFQLFSPWPKMISSSRKDKKIYEYFIVTFQTFFYSLSLFYIS